MSFTKDGCHCKQALALRQNQLPVRGKSTTTMKELFFCDQDREEYYFEVCNSVVVIQPEGYRGTFLIVKSSATESGDLI